MEDPDGLLDQQFTLLPAQTEMKKKKRKVYKKSEVQKNEPALGASNSLETPTFQLNSQSINEPITPLTPTKLV